MGDLLLGSRKYADAVVAYEITARTQPPEISAVCWGWHGRRPALGNEAEARYAREKLDRIWSNADGAVKEQD